MPGFSFLFLPLFGEDIDMLGEHSATELATLEPLGSIPIRPILGAESLAHMPALPPVGHHT